MKKVKSGRPLIDLIKLCYRAGRPPLLVGRHGVGKSQLLEQAAKELEIGYICRDLSLMEPTDLIGLPRLDGATTKYCPPNFLPSGGSGLLVLEELNRCPRYMQAPTLQLLSARTLNDYRLPDGWLPAAAINPSEEGYEADELDPAQSSRFVKVDVVPDRQEWLAWGRASGIHPGVIEYVEADPTAFDDPVSNPRAWAFVSDIVRAAARCGASQDSLQAAVVGLVGDERGTAFLKTLWDTARPLTADQILAYRGHRPQLAGWLAAGRLDLVQGSLLNLEKHLQVRRNYQAAREDRACWKSLGTFLADLPGDLRKETEGFFSEREYDVPGTRRECVH